MYEVRDVVCDYGLFEDGELKLILNSNSNAKLIKTILEIDEKHEVYEFLMKENVNVEKVASGEISNKINEIVLLDFNEQKCDEDLIQLIDEDGLGYKIVRENGKVLKYDGTKKEYETYYAGTEEEMEALKIKLKSIDKQHLSLCRRFHVLSYNKNN